MDAGVLVGVFVGTGVTVGVGVEVGGVPTMIVVSALSGTPFWNTSNTFPISLLVRLGFKLMEAKPRQAWPSNGPKSVPEPKVWPVVRLIIETVMPTSPVTNTKLLPETAEPSNSTSQRGGVAV